MSQHMNILKIICEEEKKLLYANLCLIKAE